MDGFIGFRRSKNIEMNVSLIIIAIYFVLLNFKMAAGGHLGFWRPFWIFGHEIQQKKNQIAIIMSDTFISIVFDLLKPMKPSVLP